MTLICDYALEPELVRKVSPELMAILIPIFRPLQKF